MNNPTEPEEDKNFEKLFEIINYLVNYTNKKLADESLHVGDALKCITSVFLTMYNSACDIANTPKDEKIEGLKMVIDSYINQLETFNNAEVQH